ncbi:hypothetical protein [Kitasatospora sp. NPDC051705]|uniref:hypothetical protein n=1 Tax=Kitasatospora sp. NPDC051705 TaxID=3364057 RepID=UPI003787AA3D
MPRTGPAPDDEPTERLTPGGPAPAHPSPATGRPGPTDRAEEAAVATALDPTAWATPPNRDHTDHPSPVDRAEEAPVATALDPTAWATPPTTTATVTATSEAGPGPAPRPVPQPAPAPTAPELRRFGPGVPPRAAAAWRGTAAPVDPPRRPARRRAAGWLVWAAVLLALLALLLNRCRTDPPLTVTGVTVAADPAAGPSCGGTAVITATVTTDGHPGTIRYHWLRSDGTTSGELSQPVRSGERQVGLVLRWTFDGPGSMRADAVVEILAPQALRADTTFTYSCTR